MRPNGGGIRAAELTQARRYVMEAMVGLVEAGKAAGRHKADAWHDGLVTIALKLTTSYTYCTRCRPSSGLSRPGFLSSSN